MIIYFSKAYFHNFTYFFVDPTHAYHFFCSFRHMQLACVLPHPERALLLDE